MSLKPVGDWMSAHRYQEPYVTNVATHPGRTARLLAQKLPNEFIPILFTECSGNRAFVTLSSDVSEELIAERNNWPDNWVVMTKCPHTPRISCERS